MKDDQRLLDALGAMRAQAVERGAAGEDRVGAEAERLQDVGAAPDAARHQQLDLAAGDLAGLRQDVERGDRPIGLTTAMRAEDDAVDAGVHRPPHVVEVE